MSSNNEMHNTHLDVPDAAGFDHEDPKQIVVLPVLPPVVVTTSSTAQSVKTTSFTDNKNNNHKAARRRSKQLTETFDDLDKNHRTSSYKLDRRVEASIMCTMLFIMLIGLAAGTFILVVGIRGAKQESNRQFTISATNMVGSIQSSFRDHELAGLWVHDSCYRSQQEERSAIPLNVSVAGHLGICSRQDFQKTYEYIQSIGINIVSVSFLVNITDNDRAAVENDARDYYKRNNPEVVYQGIQEFFIPARNGSQAGPSAQKPFYFPVHYTLPIAEIRAFADIDFYSSPTRRKAIDSALSSWKPVVTDRVKFLNDKDIPNAYGIFLLHPGIRTSSEQATRPNPLALLSIRIPRLIARVSGSLDRSQKVYLFDSTNSSIPPLFLGACDIIIAANQANITLLPETKMSTIPTFSSSLLYKSEIAIAGKIWTVVIVSESYQPDLIFVLFGGVGIVCASLLAAFGYYSLSLRTKKIKLVKTEADVANRLALWERQLNEHMAHEVRNPLASAIAALSFVTARASDAKSTEQNRDEMIHDIGVVNASLQFIDQLLRNMLDHYRAGSKQMKLDIQPADIEKDILEPVSAMLVTRQANVDISIDCPKNLIVHTDRIRLKQIVVNLSMNATKFVVRGFIRLRAQEIGGIVHVFVEDSGPGIPPEKRDHLFQRFQDSLDLLTQGTGIGLSVVKNLSDLMGMGIWLDKDYVSGIERCPGTRFVICTNQSVIEMYQLFPTATEDEQIDTNLTCFDVESNCQKVEDNVSLPLTTLPETLSVLYVDDDMIVRKMLSRCIRRIAPNWDLQEAASGERALEIVQTKQFDLVFMDQYMASTEKQLLGTETVRALRLNRISSVVCGLSANDVEDEFLAAGANAFMLKPFPCEAVALTTALLSILNTSNFKQAND